MRTITMSDTMEPKNLAKKYLHEVLVQLELRINVAPAAVWGLRSAILDIRDGSTQEIHVLIILCRIFLQHILKIGLNARSKSRVL